MKDSRCSEPKFAKVCQSSLQPRPGALGVGPGAPAAGHGLIWRVARQVRIWEQLAANETVGIGFQRACAQALSRVLPGHEHGSFVHFSVRTMSAVQNPHGNTMPSLSNGLKWYRKACHSHYDVSRILSRVHFLRRAPSQRASSGQLKMLKACCNDCSDGAYMLRLERRKLSSSATALKCRKCRK